jgi:hypothetical protein
MRKILFASLVACITMYATAQQRDEYFNTFVRTSAKIKLAPAVKLLPESSKYFVQYPEKLIYHNSQKDVVFINDFSFSVKLDAKRTRKAEEADYVFRLSSPGITVSPAQPEYFTESRSATIASPAITVKGYIYKFGYTMPIKLEVVNKQGVVEKTFELNNEPGAWEYHRNFINGQDFEKLAARKAIMPFATENEAMEAFKKDEKAIYQRMEYNTWFYAMDEFKKILEMSYSNYKISRNDFFSKKLVGKKSKESFPGLNEAVDKQQSLIAELGDQKKYDQAIEALKVQLEFFDDAYKNNPDMTIKSVCVPLSQACWAALFTGQLSRAANYFVKYQKVEKDEYEMYSPFREVFSDYRLHEMIRQGGEQVKINSDISVLNPKD